MSTGDQYTLVFDNKSSRYAELCVFQQDPAFDVAGIETLAWLVEPVAPTTRLTLTWTTELDFVWSATGSLAPGVVGTAVQVWPANLTTTNQVTFDVVQGAYTFRDQTQGPTSGSLTILESRNIPVNQAAVGLGMAGAATYYVQAQPNVTLTFQPGETVQYWVSFASYTAGEVLDVPSIADKTQVVYPVNVYSMTATLSADNTWLIAPTSEVNAAYLAAHEEDPDARWGADLLG